VNFNNLLVFTSETSLLCCQLRLLLLVTARRPHPTSAVATLWCWADLLDQGLSRVCPA